MTLSEDEQRTLEAIETGCRREDPGFVARLDLAATRYHSHCVVVMSQCAIWIGGVVVLIGAGLTRGLVSIGALVACYGLALILGGSVAWLRHHRPTTPTFVPPLRGRRRPR